MALRNWILSTHGGDAVRMLEDFGMALPKPKGKRTAKAKAEAVVKAEATRNAHHVEAGPQKLAINGVVDAKPVPAANGTPS